MKTELQKSLIACIENDGGGEMKGIWKVIRNPMAGYIVARVRDTSKPMHSGNIEYHGKYSDNREELERIADELNNAEVER